MRFSFAFIGAAIGALCVASSVFANHGPGASGGGVNTISGETLAPGRFEISLREDYTEFEHFTKQQALDRAGKGGEFDALRRGFVTSLDLSAGVIEDLQVGYSIGWFQGDHFISASDAPDFGQGDPSGLTDSVLTFKWRFLQGQPGNVSLIGGVKLPTGRTNFKLDNGERLSPTDQPGTGSFDFPVGLAYSRFLTSQVTFDASAVWLFRTEDDHFKAGDRFDAGMAVAYRLNESIKDFPQFSVFGEMLLVHLERDSFEGMKDPNTGSDTLYLSPGLRERFTENVSATVGPAFPVWQHVNGDQGKVEFKAAVTVTVSF
jgi:hypothetical protein